MEVEVGKKISSLSQSLRTPTRESTLRKSTDSTSLAEEAKCAKPGRQWLTDPSEELKRGTKRAAWAARETRGAVCSGPGASALTKFSGIPCPQCTANTPHGVSS